MARFSPTAIRLLRRKTGLSQAKFAELIGVNKITVCRWETGRFGPDKRAEDDLATIALQLEQGEVVPEPQRQHDPIRPIMRQTSRFPERILVALSADQIAALLDALLEGEELEPVRERTVLQTYDELADAYLDLTGKSHDS